MTSSEPVTPSAAASAAVTPASAARPACSGFDIESLRKACCSPAEAADGAGVVPVAVMRPPHRGTDAGRDLVADDDRAKELCSARALRLRQRQRGGDGGRAGM